MMEIPEDCRGCPVAGQCNQRLDQAQSSHRAALDAAEFAMDSEVLRKDAYNLLREVLFGSYLALAYGQDLLVRTYTDFPESLIDTVVAGDVAQKLAYVLDKSEAAVAVHERKLSGLLAGCTGIIQRKFVFVGFGPISCGSPQMAAQTDPQSH